MKYVTLHITALIMALTFCFPIEETSAQTGSCDDPLFQFDFDGQDSNCTISCGKVINEAIWKVGGDTCVNISDTIWLSQSSCSSSSNITEVNIKIDKEGQQITNNDFIIADIYCSDSLVSTDTM